MKKTKGEPDGIIISVIIATRDRGEKLVDCVREILKYREKDIEVLIIDQSKKSNRFKLESILSADKRWKYYHHNSVGRSRAMNFGVKVSKGIVCVFTDDDVIVSGNWLKVIKSEYSEDRVDAILGKTMPYRQLLKKEMVCPSVSPIGFEKKKMVTMDNLFDHDNFGLGNNMAIKKICFMEYGGFREWLGVGTFAGSGEDWEYIYWLVKNGGKVELNPSMMVYHDRWITGYNVMEQLACYATGVSGFLIYLTLLTRDSRFWKNFKYQLREHFKIAGENVSYLGLWRGVMIVIKLAISWFEGFCLGVAMSVLDNKNKQ
jgi:glycosyltransferase involved in cell wall biosynthesis